LKSIPFGDINVPVNLTISMGVSMKKIVETDKAPGAIGPYSQAVEDPKTGLIFTSGQLGMDPASGRLLEGGLAEQAHQVFKNLKAVLVAAGSGFDKVLKATVFLKDMDDFARVNEVYAMYFEGDFPARSAVQVARLPKDALVEIEMIATK
jgi:2-iminobutanoate/2-iminopropanoate deaminase